MSSDWKKIEIPLQQVFKRVFKAVENVFVLFFFSRFVKCLLGSSVDILFLPHVTDTLASPSLL